MSNSEVSPPTSTAITENLRAWTDGSPEALGKLVPLIQADLRRLAASHLSHERAGHTLQPTALMNEAYLRLMQQQRVRWKNRAHFFAIASRIMRRVLVDYARRRQAAKRGGTHQVRITWIEVPAAAGPDQADVIALNDAIDKLAAIDRRQARVVELMFFGGLAPSEAAEVLHISAKTVHRDWRVAKLWLYREMQQE